MKAKIMGAILAEEKPDTSEEEARVVSIGKKYQQFWLAYSRGVHASGKHKFVHYLQRQTESNG